MREKKCGNILCVDTIDIVDIAVSYTAVDYVSKIFQSSMSIIYVGNQNPANILIRQKVDNVDPGQRTLSP